MSTLYRLAGDYAELQRMIADEEVPAEQIEDTLDLLGGEIADKADRIAVVLSGIDADVAAIKAETDRLSERRRVMTARAARLRDYLAAQLGLAGKTKLSTSLRSFAVVAGRASVEIVDADAIPSQLVRVSETRTPVKAAIADALKAGDDVPGARLVTGAPSLRIR